MASNVTLFHSPNSRSLGVLALLMEMGIEYDLQVLNLNLEEESKPQFLAINPMGKVPALQHNGSLVTEQAAIYMYLADTFSLGKLAPAIDSPSRGPYLRWMVFYGSCFEPAIMDLYMKREPAPPRTNPYGSFELVWKTLTEQLEKEPYLLGKNISAVDILWGTSLRWMMMFKLVPESNVVMAYIDRLSSRTATISALVKDEELAKNQ